MTVLAPTEFVLPALGRVSLLPFLRVEYLRIMRGRLAKLIWAILIYSVAMMPFIMQKPPPEIVHAIGAWLGAAAVPSKLVLFMWVDAAMNKFAMMLGPVLAGGIIVDEQSRGSLDLLVSKPIRAADYFSVKLIAACAAMATFYGAGVGGALLTFPWRVPGFDPAGFLVLSAVHLFATLFAVTLSATIAVITGRKLVGMLMSVSVLSLLVGLAFLGFYYPAYRGVSYLNPFFNGVVLIGVIDDYDRWDVARLIGTLILFNLTIAWIGRRGAVALLEER